MLDNFFKKDKIKNFYLRDSLNLENKTILFRASLNVPVVGENIENEFRLNSIRKTLDFLIEKKAKIVVIGHIGRDENQNLEKVYDWFRENFKNTSFFPKSFESFSDQKADKIKKKIEDIRPGGILLLDNLRSSKLEKENDKAFAKTLASFGEVYVNDSFSVAHRSHASLNKVMDFFEDIYIGFQFQKELEVLGKLKKKNSKSIFILGGAKIATKIPMIEKLEKKFDMLILGGAIVNNFFKAAGHEIGQSLYDPSQMNLEKYLKNKKFFIPKKVIACTSGECRKKNIGDIFSESKIVDIAPEAFLPIEKKLEKAKFVFFNGPMGYYEEGHKRGTEYLLRKLANSNNFFIAGGGNTASLIYDLKLEDNVDFISTGGGALMKYISDETLPFLEKLKEE